LADGAININYNCRRGEWTGGQLFDSDGWNVILNSVPQCDVGYTYRKREVSIPSSPRTRTYPLTHIKESAALLEAREADVTLPVERDLALEPRGNYLGLFCIKDGIPGQNWNWIDISSGYIDQAIAEFDNGPTLVSGAGPGYCGQVGCYDRSAVYWCNDVSLIFISSSCLFPCQFFEIMMKLTDWRCDARIPMLSQLTRMIWRRWLDTLSRIARRRSRGGTLSLVVSSSIQMATTSLFVMASVTADAKRIKREVSTISSDYYIYYIY
jgi:hypothetical protein